MFVNLIRYHYRNFSQFNASKELPFDLEDAVLLWMNKINEANISTHQKYNIEASVKVRYHKDRLVEKTVFPRVNHLNDCFIDGKTMLSLLLFYFPDVLLIDSKF